MKIHQAYYGEGKDRFKAMQRFSGWEAIIWMDKLNDIPRLERMYHQCGKIAALYHQQGVLTLFNHVSKVGPCFAKCRRWSSTTKQATDMCGVLITESMQDNLRQVLSTHSIHTWSSDHADGERAISHAYIDQEVYEAVMQEVDPLRASDMQAVMDQWTIFDRRFNRLSKVAGLYRLAFLKAVQYQAEEGIDPIGVVKVKVNGREYVMQRDLADFGMKIIYSSVDPTVKVLDIS